MARQSGSDTTKSTPVPDSFVVDTSSNEEHHGIPRAIFFEDIANAVSKHSAQSLIDKLSSLSQKYRFFEERLIKGKDTLEDKMQEVKRALHAVKTLAEKSSRPDEKDREIETQFELSDGIYIRAAIPPTSKVCLWLGANVMVEYSHSEAIELLTKNLTSAESSFEETCNDINFLRDQLNTTDVNLSRVYNHHVQTVRTAAEKTKAARVSGGAVAKT